MSYFDAIAKSLGGDNPTSRPDPVENRDCFERAVKGYRPGSEVDVKKFIINNMRLVTSAVQRFIQYHPSAVYLEEDLFAEGLYALTKAVRTLVKEFGQNALKLQRVLDSFEDGDGDLHVIIYIYISVYKHVQHLYETDSSNTIADRTRDRHTPEGQFQPTRKINVSETFFEQLIEEPFNEIFFMEDLIDACISDVERSIIKKKHEGFKDTEIAEELNLSTFKVCRIKKKVYQNFCAKNHLS